MSANDAQGFAYVVDDDAAVLDAVGLLLESVSIDHACYPNAQRFLDEYQPGRLACLILDIRMPGMTGLELQRELAAKDPSLPIIFITGHGDIPMAVDAMRKGAYHFLRKPFRDQELLDSITGALAQRSRTQKEAHEKTELASRIELLTAREREVFEQVAQGKANKVIAAEMGISERTVEIHRSHVMSKTNSRSLAELVRLKVSLESPD